MRRIFPTLLMLGALAMFAFACDDADDDDDNDVDDDDDDDGPPQVDFDGWQFPDPLEGVIYRITDGVWEGLFIPDGFKYYASGGVTGFGDAAYTWQEQDDCAVWRLGNGWKELYRGSSEDAHLSDIAFYDEDAFIGYLYDHYNEPNTDKLVKYDPATDELEWINQDIEPLGVFAGFQGDAYAYDEQSIYRYDGVELTAVATLPAGEIRAAGPLGDSLFVVTQDATVFWDGAQWSTLLEDAYSYAFTDADGDMLLAQDAGDDEYYYLRYANGGAEPLDWFDASGCNATLLPGDAALFRCRYAPPDLTCPEDVLVNFRVLVVDGVPYCDAAPETGILLIDGASEVQLQ